MSYGPLSVRLGHIGLPKGYKRVPNGGPQEIENELKTRVPTKTSKTSFRTLFATFQPCPLCSKTVDLGSVSGHFSGVPRELHKRAPPKHTSRG